MPTYHIQFGLAADGTSRHDEHFECFDDYEAITRAREFIDGRDVELWQGTRLVAAFPHNGEGLKIDFLLPYQLPPKETKH